MISFLFDVAEHEEYGTVGLRMAGKPHFEPIGGMGVAHDMLEHFRDDPGTLSGELEALGASLFVRGEHYYSDKGQYVREPWQNISGEFIQQVYHCENRDEYELRDGGNHRKLDDEWAEDQIRKTVREGFRLVRSDLDDDRLPTWLTRWDRRRILMGWMRRGFRRARRRYAKARDGMVTYTFRQIEDRVEKYLRVQEAFGQQVRLSASIRTGEVVLTEIEPQW